MGGIRTDGNKYQPGTRPSADSIIRPYRPWTPLHPRGVSYPEKFCGNTCKIRIFLVLAGQFQNRPQPTNGADSTSPRFYPTWPLAVLSDDRHRERDRQRIAGPQVRRDLLPGQADRVFVVARSVLAAQASEPAATDRSPSRSRFGLQCSGTPRPRSLGAAGGRDPPAGLGAGRTFCPTRLRSV